MKMLPNIKKRTWLFGLIMMFSYQVATSQNRFCERLGDNQLETWIGHETSTNSNYKDIIKEDEFKFHNLSKHSVSFNYNGSNVHLEAGALSPSFKKPIPASLSDCRVLIDGIQIQNYYSAVDYIEKEYNHLPVSSKFVSDKSIQELKNDINVYTKTLTRVQQIDNNMPAWFAKMLSIDFRIKQVNDWLKSHNDWLSEKTSATASNTQNEGSASSNSSSGMPAAQSGPVRVLPNNPNQSSSSNTNTMSESQRREIEMRRQLAELEQQRKAKEESAAAISTSLQGVANMFAQGMAEDRARAEARDARYALIRQQNAITANALLNQYKADAERGDEAAIAKVIEAYFLLEYKEEQKSFMQAMMNKYNSPVATTAATAYYTNVMKNYKTTSNRYMRRGIGKLVLLTGIGVGLAYAGSEIDIYDEPDRASESEILTYSGGGLMIVGVLAGLSTMAKSGYKYKPEYVEAQQRLSGIQQKVRLSFTPKIDLKNSYGMSLKMTF